MAKTNKVKSKAIEFLIEKYVDFKKIEIQKRNGNKSNTAQSYGKYVPIVFEKGEFLSTSEKNFLVLLPKLLKAGRNEDIKKLINLTKRSVFIFDWGSNLKSYKTYILHFLNYVEKNINKLNDIFCKREDVEQLSEVEHERLNEDLTKSIVFSYECLFTKFKSRLRSQERTSGDKIWLTLDYIAKIYRKNNKSKTNAFTTWLEEMTKGIYIHYMNEKDDEIKSIQFNKNISLEFQNNNEDGYYDVYVIWDKERHPVYTPTGVGNKKEPMSVKSISEIDIDHVKPIDLTLRELGNKEGKEGIETLKMVSDSFKEVVKRGKDVNDAIEELFKKDHDFTGKLTEDLKKIKDDTVLRLMSSKFNENKSNGLTYEKILLRQDGTYIGILGYIDKDDEGERLTIYQELKENGIIRATKKDEKTKGEPVTKYKEIINFI